MFGDRTRFKKKKQNPFPKWSLHHLSFSPISSQRDVYEKPTKVHWKIELSINSLDRVELSTSIFHVMFIDTVREAKSFLVVFGVLKSVRFDKILKLGGAFQESDHSSVEPMIPQKPETARCVERKLFILADHLCQFKFQELNPEG